MKKAGLILLSTLGLSLVACSASLPPAASTPAAPAVSSSQLAGVTLTLPAPRSLSPQYLNPNKTTRIDV